MNSLNESLVKSTLTSSQTSSSESNSVSSSSATANNLQIHHLDQRLWRAIDFLQIIVMIFSLYTAIIVATLRHELLEQCPLYAKLYLRDNATQFSTDTIAQQTIWGNVYTCEFASFAYLSAFVLSFISLWIHIVFRRVIRTERLLRLPIGLLILFFGLVAILATIIVTDGVIKFCLNSQAGICSSSSSDTDVFSRSRWKIISLPVGGWLTTLSLLLNTLFRGIQLFSKPKKSPEALKSLLHQLMAQKQQHKVEKEISDYGSQISHQSRDKNHSQMPARRHSTERIHNREFTPELYPYYYPSIPQYRQIEKRSRFQRICCPCFRRRRRDRPHSFHEPYRPYVVPEEYFHRLNHLKQNGAVPSNLCHRHSLHHPIEQQTQTDLPSSQKNLDQTNETPFLGRRRSSVRFEDEIPIVKVSNVSSVPLKTEYLPNIQQTTVPLDENDLQRNVSFRNNEDDLWTTVTINAKQSESIQSSHFNRLAVENLSRINTAISNNDNGVTAIHVNSRPNDCIPSESVAKEIPIPPQLPLQSVFHGIRSRQKLSPPPPPCFKTTRYRHKPPPPSSRTHTASSEDDTDLRNIKPVEEINTLIADKYNYTDVSQALKSNVERLKSTFIHTQDNPSHYDHPKNLRTKISQKSFQNCNIDNPSSDC